jgi:fido (protein-threonine AMPylation protein)
MAKKSIFEEYQKVGEPADKAEKAKNWGIAIGLQAVDGLTPSKYLYEVARENIEGKITSDQAEKLVRAYYKKNPPTTTEEQEKNEADQVSSRINTLLGKNSFSFSPAEYISIHKYLFDGILDRKITGKIRTYDITKSEPVLNGDTVDYGRADSIRETLNYDFKQEKEFDYKGLSRREIAQHIAKFTSGIWQIHAFAEGNTRTTAVFIIKYLRTLGFKGIGNKLFNAHSKYFRNALVRANYQNLATDVPYTMEYLNRFFGNLILGENNRLDSADLQLHTDKNTKHTDKSVDVIAGLTKGEREFWGKIVGFIEKNGEIGNEQARELTGKGAETAKKTFAALVAAGLLMPIGERKARKYRLRKN